MQRAHGPPAAGAAGSQATPPVRNLGAQGPANVGRSSATPATLRARATGGAPARAPAAARDLRPQSPSSAGRGLATVLTRGVPAPGAPPGEPARQAQRLGPQDVAQPAWACGTTILRSQPPPASAAANVASGGPNTGGLQAKEPINVARARASPPLAGEPFPRAAASAAPGGAELEGGARSDGDRTSADMLGLVRAYAAAGCVGDALFEAAAASLQRQAERADGPGALPPLRAEPSGPTPEQPCILLAQPRLCVIWKPPGWTVSVADGGAGGQARGPFVHEWLAEKLGGGFPIAAAAGSQHGLVHRLDRDTSGALLWASSHSGYLAARLRFAARRVDKRYVCLCEGWLAPGPRLLEAPLRADRRASPPRSEVSPHGQPARTEILAVGHLLSAQGEAYSLVQVRLHSGRQHQIRVHLQHEGHPLVGDSLYGAGATPWCPRLFLHACRVGIDVGDGPIDLQVPMPEDLARAAAQLAPVDRPARPATRAGG